MAALPLLFDAVLPRLKHLYNRGLLVPFLGAGMSAEGCPLWRDFVGRLEEESGINVGPGTSSPAELVQRAARAVRRLKNREPEQFSSYIRRALQMPNARLTKATEELSKAWWPLAITTNYDDWFYSAWNLCHASGSPLPQLSMLQLCGRNRPDCERVLNSLRSPDSPILWAIQGFIGGQSGDTNGLTAEPSKLLELSEELVVGHEEYRRVTHGEPGFRRAFAEVFRSRSFLFLGTSLSDPYFLNLFDEVLELQGSLDHVHYAFLKEGAADIEFLRDRLQILAIEYKDHSDLPIMLSRLAGALQSPQPIVESWSYSLNASPVLLNYSVVEDLRLIRGGLPSPNSSEALAISAGASSIGTVEAHDLLLSGFGEQQLRKLLVLGGNLHDQLDKASEHVWRLSDRPAFVVVARDLSAYSDYRDARKIRDATVELLTCAENAGFDTVSSMLLAAGKNRKFPPYVSLMQMVRGFARYRRSSSRPLRLKIHIVDPSVLQLISAMRLDVQEMLSAGDVRFWIEIWRGRRDVLRHIEFSDEDQSLQAVLEKYDVPSQGWEVHVIPSPIQGSKVLGTAEIFNAVHDPWTVAGVGLLPGSILRVFPSSRQGQSWR